jgi:hypothetical protein
MEVFTILMLKRSVVMNFLPVTLPSTEHFEYHILKISFGNKNVSSPDCRKKT